MPNPVLSCLSGHSDPIVLKPFDVNLWYSGVQWRPKLLNISSDIESEMAFSAHCTQIWKLNQISMTIIRKLHENAFDAATGSSDAWRHPRVGGNCAEGHENVVKIATSACSPYAFWASSNALWACVTGGNCHHFSQGNCLPLGNCKETVKESTNELHQGHWTACGQTATFGHY